MPTKISVKNLPKGYQSIITNGTHSIVGDEPLLSKGTDLGLSPTEMVLSGLAMCKVSTVRFIARKNNWEIRDVKANLEQIVTKGDGGLKTTVTINLSIEGDLTAEQKDELIKQADRCYIHRILNGEWDIQPIKIE
ncbi:MAG: OsmC family protein [Chitinophagaceae bacterium]|nr:OsmC family protein [Chitinophagaceae bacterium]